MSSNTIVVKRYAKALFEAAQEQNIAAKVEEELKSVVALVKENAEFRKFLHHPNIAASAKVDVLKQAFGEAISAPLFNTLQLLIERGRESAFDSLLDYYVSIANEAFGQANATVYTPFPLDEAEKAKITEQFGKLSGKTIRLEQVIDPTLLGGIQVRIGDRLYDGSLRGKLAKLEQTLKQGQAL